jgi:hypothetical protein
MFFLRHASAAHNEEYEKYKPTNLGVHEVITHEKYLDSPLTVNGIEQIFRERNNIISSLQGKYIDVILVSPLKRALQTLLYTLPAFHKIPKIYVVGCISELELPGELKLDRMPIYNIVKGDPRDDIELKYSPFLPLCNFDTYFLKDPQLLHECRNNEVKLNKFKEICESFKGKIILVISHHNFIKAVIGESISRYKLISSPEKLP